MKKISLMVLFFTISTIVYCEEIKISLNVDNLIPPDSKYAIVKDKENNLLGTYIFEEKNSYFYYIPQNNKVESHCIIYKYHDKDMINNSDFMKRNNYDLVISYRLAHDGKDGVSEIIDDSIALNVSDLIIKNNDIVKAYFDTGEVLELYQYQLMVPFLFK